jgi:hypothetical protein
MAMYVLRVRASGRDLDDALATEFYGAFDGLVSMAHGALLITVFLDEDDLIRQARQWLEAVEQRLNVVVEAVDRDLVNVADIARRVGRTRQAVQLWVTGKRGPGSFPVPVGAPGGSRVWAWADVEAWLDRGAVAAPDAERPLPTTEAAVIDGWIAGRRCRRDLAQKEARVFAANVPAFEAADLMVQAMDDATRVSSAVVVEQDVQMFDTDAFA